MRLSAFETFTLYLSIKNHFTREKYDYFKYAGKTTASKESFAVRRDRFHFQRISRMYSPEEMRDVFVSNFLLDKTWIGDMMNEDAHSNYIDYVRRNQSLAYTFTNDLDNIFSEYDPKIVFKASGKDFPPILRFIISNTVSPETVVILNTFIGFVQNFDEVFSKQRMKIEKYTPFVNYDKKKMRGILKEKIDGYIRLSPEKHEEGSSKRTEAA